MLRKSVVVLAVLISLQGRGDESRLGPEAPLIPFDYPYQREQTRLHAAANSDHFMVAWTDTTAKSIDALADGRIVTLIQPSSDSLVTPRSLTAGARNFLLTWNDRADLLAARVGFDGTLLDKTPIVLELEAFADAAVAYSGSAFGIAWATGSLHTASISDDGVFSSGIDAFSSPANTGFRSPQMLWTGRDFLLLYSVERFLAIDPVQCCPPSAIGALVLNADTTANQPMIDPIFDDVGSGDLGISAARLGNMVTIVWREANDPQNAIGVAQTTTTGQVLAAPRPLKGIRIDAFTQMVGMRLTSDGHGYVLCWLERSFVNASVNYFYRLKAIRLDPNANPIDPAPFDLSQSVILDSESTFDVVNTPSGIMIAYSGTAPGRNEARRIFTRTLAHLDAGPTRRRSAPH